ncbi:MAG: amidohydrolase family protein [Terracidiphilus sp.]
MTPPAPRCSQAAPRELVLAGARVARTSQIAEHLTVHLRGHRIQSLLSPQVRPIHAVQIDLSGCLVLPGLINAHDHLDFSLYPQLGRGPYPSWREWAEDIYRPRESPVRELQEVPRELRFWWGGIRNLLSGVTTVSQHDRYLPEVLGSDFPVHVPAEYGWAHSVSDAPSVARRANETPADWPFLIHLGEGTNTVAAREFDELAGAVALNPRIGLIHAVGLTSTQWQTVRQLNMGVVWCPVSNLFTLGKTLPLRQIKSLTNVALGTDSPLTAAGDLLDHIRFLHEMLRVSPALLYLLATTRAANLLRLKEGQGRLEPGGRASLIVVRDRDTTPANTLVQLAWIDIELVVQSGRIVLLSPALAANLPPELTSHLESLWVDGTECLIHAPVAHLVNQTAITLGTSFKLSGRSIALEPAQSFPQLHREGLSHDCLPFVTKMSFPPDRMTFPTRERDNDSGGRTRVFVRCPRGS